MEKNILLCLGVGCVFALTQANRASAASFVNGDFDSPPAPGADDFLPIGSIDIVGWVVVGTAGSGNTAHYVAPGLLWNNTGFLDLTGNSGGAGIEQASGFPTTVGVQYTVGFDAMNGSSVYPGPPGYSGNAFTVSATGAGAQTYSLAPGAFGPLTYTFTAANTSTKLRFMDASGFDSNAGWIDNVALVPVPEPHQYSLIGVTGLLGLAGWTRLKRKAA